MSINIRFTSRQVLEKCQILSNHSRTKINTNTLLKVDYLYTVAIIHAMTNLYIDCRALCGSLTILIILIIYANLGVV